MPQFHSGLNPILAAAGPLLTIAPQIRYCAHHPDPPRLKDELTSAIRRFEQVAAEKGIPHRQMIAARYVLCSFLDEAAASTPWGGGGVWARDTLLVRLHNETWGGEKVFQLLTQFAKDPSANRDLLELIYVCISLGFEGRYRVVENGRSQLDTLRDRLFRMIQEHRGPVERALAVKWRPANVQKRSWIAFTPLWVWAAVSLAIATLAFSMYRMWLNARSDTVFSAIQGMRPMIVQAAHTLPRAPVAPTPAPQPRLAGLLEAEVAAGLVAVREEIGKSVITLRGDGAFEPGSAQISSAFLPLVGRIGDELKKHPGLVVVSGHTDSQPIRSMRFPSNFHLSQERAEVVARILAGAIGATRIKAEGHADAEPVAANDIPAGRARNRRVEITLFPAASGAAP